MSKHDELKETAIRWLYAVGCAAFADEVPTQNGVADALGVKKNGDVYYIEAKASRSDLICNKQKRIYQCSLMGGDTYLVGQFAHGIDFYYLIVADGVTVEPELYPRFGVIDERGMVIRRAGRFKTAEGEHAKHVINIAHRLVYRVYGKLYQVDG